MPPRITPKPTPTTAEVWTNGRVSFTIGSRTTRIECKVLGGSLAYHKAAWSHGDCWSVTHYPTGLMITLLATEEEAKAAAELLWTDYCLAFRLKTAEEVKKTLPKWFEKWIKMCRVSQKMIDPEPYRTGKRK